MLMASKHEQCGPRKASHTGLTDHDTLKINVSGTKYAVVSTVAKELGLATVHADTNECDVYWIDGAISLEKFLEMKHYQKVNHFPGMGEISRKDSLGRNMQRMRKENPSEYSFVPQTWVLPGDYNGVSSYMRELKRKRRNRTFIIKPHNGSMGNGISLARSIEDIPRDQNVVVQEYIDKECSLNTNPIHWYKPLLLDGFKLDLRVYVLITSCNPLRIFVYKDGLVRLSTQHYTAPTDENIQEQFIHLTNYSINKHSDSFDASEGYDKGSKRTIKYFNGWLALNGYNVSEMWAKIYDILIKTLIVAHPHLVHSYSACRPGRSVEEKCQCFEVLGFDILLDKDLKPWLIEVNRSPSFGTDAPLDLVIKRGVIKDALNIINLSTADRKRSIVAHKVASRRRLLVTPSKSRYDFLGEQEEADYEIKKKKEEVKERLLTIRRQKALKDHENECMGDYVRVYPTTDWSRARIYEGLLETAAKICLVGRSQPGSRSRRRSFFSSLQTLKEHELMDLLSQYEYQEQHGPDSPPRLSYIRPATSHYQPLSVADSHSPMDTMYAVMAARVAEEEQVQRMMMSLNDTKPSYPLKTQDEVHRVLEEINADLLTHRPNIASFWMVSLDSTKRKQLLVPLKDLIKRLLQSHWRTTNLDSVKLFHVLNRLFSYLLSRGGKGLWSVFVPLHKSWEADFRDKSEVLSMTEIVCCRKVVELCQSTLIAGYYYHHLHRPKRQSKSTSCKRIPTSSRRPSSIPKCPSLPVVIPHPSYSIKQRPYSQTRITSNRPPPTRFRQTDLRFP